MVDTLVLGASAARREGSSPFIRTIFMTTMEPEPNFWIEDMLEPPQAPELLLVWSQPAETVDNTFARVWPRPNLNIVHEQVRFARLKLFVAGVLTNMRG